jgi:hypothetical protein
MQLQQQRLRQSCNAEKLLLVAHQKQQQQREHAGWSLDSRLCLQVQQKKEQEVLQLQLASL